MKKLVVALLFLISLVAAGRFMTRYTIWTTTPKIDRARNMVQNSLKSQGVNDDVIRDVNESAYWFMVNDACGGDYATKTDADRLKAVIYTFSAKGLDIPLYKFDEWVTVMKDALASALRTNTAETAAFCREHKQLVGKTARGKKTVAQ
jgi:hypothetical protein